MSETVLSRQLNSTPVDSLTSLQRQVDEMANRFVEEATDPKTLGALAAASLAYRVGRASVFGLKWAQGAAFLQKPLSIGFGFTSEVTAFEFAQRTLHTIEGEHIGSPIKNQSNNLWSWNGPGGWKQGLALSAVTFGTLKGAGFLAREQNIVFQHFFQSAAMVTGHQAAGILNLASKPEGSLAQQFLHAEATNLQLGAGIGLVHVLAPRLMALERGLDLSISWPSQKIGNPFLSSLVPVGARSTSSMVEREIGPVRLFMSGTEDGSEGERPSSSPTVVPSLSPFDRRSILSLAIELGVVIPPQEFITSLSQETRMAFRSKVMDLISTREIASKLSSSHMAFLRLFVIGEDLAEAQLITSLSELIETGRQKNLVDPPSESTVTLPPSEPLVSPGFTPNLSGPSLPRETNVLLPHLGEVSIFSTDASSLDQTEDVFGVGPAGVLMVATGGHRSIPGKHVSQLAVNTVLEQMKIKGANLGDAILEADQRIRADGEGGEVMASAVHVHPNGRVEAALAGNVEIWILFGDRRGHYGLVPYWTVLEGEPTTALGAEVFPLPPLVQKEASEVPGEILYGPIPFPRLPGSTEKEQPLVFEEGDGLLIMTEGLARYYQSFHHQLLNLLEQQTSAEEIRRKIQEDAAARVETLRWRRGLKFEEGRLSTLMRAKIPEGMPMAGDYIDSVGEVYDADEGGNLIAYFGEEKSQTALVYLHRPPKNPGSAPKEEPVSSPQVIPPPIQEEDPFAGTFDEELVETEDRSAWLPPLPPEKETEELKPVPIFPSDQPRPHSLAEVGTYLENVKSYKSVIRYPVNTFGEFAEQFGRNFQAGGVFLRTPSPLPVGSFLDMEMTLKNGDLILRGTGQVAWNRQLQGSNAVLPPGMGVKFLELEPESQSILRAILAGKDSGKD